ncbi:PREDICTED: protein IWS1 homolog 2-like [Camelina sativa]|uniref:Protein IWS1 homolog 2-like n=1 Tax=Camelina sativa TaxID=90675 RepID=A0ABM1QKV6_CAMSA|nr:PREDICTED: protein IWS1 homolog 2-like [Camelina sativa]
MSHEEDTMQALSHSDDEWVNELEDVLTDPKEKEESKFTRRRLEKKSNSVPDAGDGVAEDLDDCIEPDVNDKVGKKRQRKKDESVLDKSKNKKRKKRDDSTEVQEMWDSITNDKNPKDVDKDEVKRLRKEDNDEIKNLFKLRPKKSKVEKNASESAMQVEQVIATLEIAVEDDVIQNREGKPAINKLMKLPLLINALSKKPLQAEFLDHGVLNLLKNWLEPLPDGSLPNINIRTAILEILKDLRIDLDQDSRREQFIKSGIGKVIMFLSKSDEETTPNRRLANDLINKWGRIIYNNSTRYDTMLSKEERQEQQQMLLRRQNKTRKVSERKTIICDTDVELYVKPKSKLGTWTGGGRTQIPNAMSMDVKIRPQGKVDVELVVSVKKQKEASTREKIIKKLQNQKVFRKRGMQALKPSADGRTMFKYL